MQPTQITVRPPHNLQFVCSFVVRSIVRRGLAMMSKRNVSAWNPSLCTDLTGFACSLVLCALLVSQSSRTCKNNEFEQHPGRSPYPYFPPLTASSFRQLHDSGRPRALLQSAPVDPVSTLPFEHELHIVDSYANLLLTVATSFVLFAVTGERRFAFELSIVQFNLLILRLTLFPLDSRSQRPGDCTFCNLLEPR